MAKKVKKIFVPHHSIPEWFQYQILEIELDMRKLFDMRIKKTIDEDKSNEAFVENYSYFESYFEEEGRDVSDSLNFYEFFKKILEKDSPLFGYEGDLFSPSGVKRDFAPLTIPCKNAIRAQCLAQVLYYKEKNSILNKKTLVPEIKKHQNSPWDFSTFNNCTIERWIGGSFSDLEGPKVGRPRKYKVFNLSATIPTPDRKTNILVPIPGIFINGGTSINFLKLRFVLQSIVHILKHHQWSIEQILESQFIQLYVDLLPFQFYLPFFVKDWVREVYE